MDTSSTEAKLANAKSVLTTVASVAGTLMLARSVALDFLPRQFQDYVFFNIYRFFRRFSTQLTIVVDEYDGFVKNEIYDAANVYLGSLISPSTQRLKVTKPAKENDFTVKMEQGVEIVDVYQGVKFKWVLVCRQVERRNFHNRRDFNASLISETRSFRVSFPKKHKNMVLQSYFPHIVKEGKSIKREKRTPRIFTVDYNNRYGNPWGAMNLDHPSNFDTLALDMKVKDTILKDLEMFVKRKDYYVKVGKAWKRGYLLYGPPGTGKSSMIAAMANYLKFDIYELELTEVRSNSHLKRLLLAAANRSILVVEDIDCTIEFHDRFAKSRTAQTRRNPPENQVTLSGFLNFLDGLWSSCGDERIIVFTTNHKDKLDPALLRPGRMDVHIHMSYCTPHSFKVLAANYLGIKDHRLFGEVEDLIRATEVTPAEVAEQLLRSDDIVTVLNELVEFLILKKKKKEETKAKVKQEESAVEVKGISVDKDNKVDDEGKAVGS